MCRMPKKWQLATEFLSNLALKRDAKKSTSFSVFLKLLMSTKFFWTRATPSFVSLGGSISNISDSKDIRSPSLTWKQLKYTNKAISTFNKL